MDKMYISTIHDDRVFDSFVIMAFTETQLDVLQEPLRSCNLSSVFAVQ